MQPPFLIFQGIVRDSILLFNISLWNGKKLSFYSSTVINSSASASISRHFNLSLICCFQAPISRVPIQRFQRTSPASSGLAWIRLWKMKKKLKKILSFLLNKITIIWHQDTRSGILILLWKIKLNQSSNGTISGLLKLSYKKIKLN